MQAYYSDTVRLYEYHPAVALCESETESVAPTTSPPNGLYGYGNVSMFMMFMMFKIFLEVRIVSDDYFFI
jgi:hypothetical protein